MPGPGFIQNPTKTKGTHTMQEIKAKPGEWTVRMDKYRATWNYFTTNPQGGGFGSNYCGPKYIAVAKAVAYIPLGAEYLLITNGKTATRMVRGARFDVEASQCIG
jgi:hypothetical protein